MTELPPPVIRVHDGISVLRDDLLPGGTKRRAIPVFFNDRVEEYVYASPVQGAAQLALAYTAREHGKRATIFCAARKTPHANTLRVRELGAQVIEVPLGYLSNVTAKAIGYAQRTGAMLLPFGLDAPKFVYALSDVAKAIPIQPKEVWSIASSGVLSRALQLAWPDAKFYGIQVGHAPIASKAVIMGAPERFEKDAKEPPPFPSCGNYDAKAWQFIKRYATLNEDTLFWNVSA
jgi:hypothetical protein